jgi:diguanylate cyclase (GGDEF)-like protein
MNSLSKLPGRQEFDEAFARMKQDAKRTGKPLSLLLVGVDAEGFKSFIDEFGHVEGDKALQQALPRIPECIVQTMWLQDFVAFLGPVGSELRVDALLPDTSLFEAAVRAQQIIARIMSTFADIPGHRFVKQPSKRVARSESGLVISITLRAVHE